MNCKNCLCDEVCYKQDCVEDEILLSDRNDIEKYCQDFKDESKFIELPCKVGDTLYILDYDTSMCDKCPDYCSELECLRDFDLFPDVGGRISKTCPKHTLQIIEYPNAQLFEITIWLKNFGTIVFTDKSKAEAKLKELNNGR